MGGKVTSGEPVFWRVTTAGPLRLGKPHWSESSNRGIVCETHRQIRCRNLPVCPPWWRNGETLGVLHLRYDLDAHGQLGS